MKESGIVRKLDNLGRLVIPKEIRRCMRIKEGSPIEFGLLPTGEIVLNKYSLVGQVKDYSDDFAAILGELCDCMVLVCDRDKVLSTYGCSKKTTLCSKISQQLFELVNSKCNSIIHNKNDSLISLINGDNNTYYSQLIMPINIQGDIEGVVVLADVKGNKVFGDGEIMSMRVVSKFISKQME